mgnify:CR=1 FL=1
MAESVAPDDESQGNQHTAASVTPDDESQDNQTLLSQRLQTISHKAINRKDKHHWNRGMFVQLGDPKMGVRRGNRMKRHGMADQWNEH